MTSLLAARAVLRRVVARFAAIPSTFRPGPLPDELRGPVALLSALVGGGTALGLVLLLAFNTVLAT